MADDATDLQTISSNLEATYQALNSAASNIQGLLAVGQATCDEVQAYNLWALATYQVQKGMLATLRAGGEQNVPALPPDPILFAWNGVEGVDAVNISCSGQESSLSGSMKRALKGPSDASSYLSLDQVHVVTIEGSSYVSDTQPTYKDLIDTQNAQAGLGNPVIFIVIAAITVAVSVAITALMSYLKSNSIQVETTERTKAQAAAFANYTQARLSCLSQCTANGGSTADCVSTCKKVVDKPSFSDPFESGSWSTLQWVGLVSVVTLGALVFYKVYQKRMRGESLFPSLPDFSYHDEHEEAHAG